MPWKNENIWRSGKSRIYLGNEERSAEYDFGTILTGRQRVFHRYFVRVGLPNDVVICGEDEASICAALRMVGSELDKLGYRLDAAGLDPDWHESGLSFNSSWGYVGHGKAVMMMTPAPRHEKLEASKA